MAHYEFDHGQRAGRDQPYDDGDYGARGGYDRGFDGPGYRRDTGHYPQYGMRADRPGDYGRYGDDHGSGYVHGGYDSAQQGGPDRYARSGYGGYGGGRDAGGYGVAARGESFEDEYRRREARNDRPRSIPTGLSHNATSPGWGGSGDPARTERHIDPEYHQWRSEQMRQMDAEYDEWRKERYQKFSDDFNGWRSQRSQRGADKGTASEDPLPGTSATKPHTARK